MNEHRVAVFVLAAAMGLIGPAVHAKESFRFEKARTRILAEIDAGNVPAATRKARRPKSSFARSHPVSEKARRLLRTSERGARCEY